MLHVLECVGINIGDDEVVILIEFFADQMMEHGLSSRLSLEAVRLADHALPFLSIPWQFTR